MNSNTKAYVIAVNFFTVSLALWAYVVPDLFGIGPDLGPIANLIAGVASVIVGLLISIYLEVIGRSETIQQQIIEEISNGYTVRKIGAPREADTQIRSDVMAAKRVRNVHVGVDDLNAVEIYHHWLTKPDAEVWEDITGMPELFHGRFTEISFPARQIAEHHVYVLREFSHIINFIILDFPTGRKSKVYFGWIANDTQLASQIMSSTDEAIVMLFAEQFKNLKKMTWNAIPDIERSFNGRFLANHSYGSGPKRPIGPSSLVDKSGVWETVSYHVDEKGDLKVGSLAVVQIDFSIDDVNVNANVFLPNGNTAPSFTSFMDSTFKLNSLYFTYKLKQSGTTGICHYKFWRDDVFGKVLTGVFCDTHFKSRNSVIGFFLGDKVDMKQYQNPDYVLKRLSELEKKVQRFDPDQEFIDGPELGQVL